MSCCNEKIVVENCISSQSDCGSAISELFDATLGIAPKFAVIQITNTGSCPAVFFAGRTFDAPLIPTLLGVSLSTLGVSISATGAVTVPATVPGYLDTVFPNSTETITVNDLQTLLFACGGSLTTGPTPGTTCSVTVKITATFCVPSCSSGCSGCRGSCTEPVLVESCITTDSACGIGPMRLFNGSLGTIPKFAILQVTNTGTCTALISVLRSFDTAFNTLLSTSATTAAPGLTPNASAVIIISDAAVIEALCVMSTVLGNTCSLSATLKAFYCVASCNSSAAVEVGSCKVSFRGRESSSCGGGSKSEESKSCSIRFL